MKPGIKTGVRTALDVWMEKQKPPLTNQDVGDKIFYHWTTVSAWRNRRQKMTRHAARMMLQFYPSAPVPRNGGYVDLAAPGKRPRPKT